MLNKLVSILQQRYLDFKTIEQIQVISRNYGLKFKRELNLKSIIFEENPFDTSLTSIFYVINKS
ncbi:hypothetical protein T07_5721 [Trichinella nelsoni]|uniref:Uncharacterized protein n=1 Tax=Trichinella nelsoni TaxID=6336 RepID=A0A0V0RHY4_9BILA|nr:hypothetical protein T07_5721 [Trichinella nelsoni]